MGWVILSLTKFLQTAMHWQNRLFLTMESLPIHLFFLTVYYNVVYKHKSMQWRHWSMCIALRDINKKGVEIGERQNRCHNNSVVSAFLSCFNVSFCKTLELKKVYVYVTHCRRLGRRSRWQVFTCCLSTVWWHHRHKYTPRLWNRFVVIFEKVENIFWFSINIEFKLPWHD